MCSTRGKIGMIHKKEKCCCCGDGFKKAGGVMLSLMALFSLLFLVFNIISRKKIEEVCEYEDMF